MSDGGCDARVPALVARGDLYAARRLCLAHCLLTSPPQLDGGLWSALSFPAAPPPRRPASLPGAELDESCTRACSAQWVASTGALFRHADHLTVVSRAHARHELAAGSTMHECGSGDEPDVTWLCREVGNSSRSFLRLPALRDVSVRLTLGSGSASHAPRVLRLDQDGFLRPFEPSTVLWPAGYLLARWATDEAQCRRWRRSGLPLLELGAGVGAPSIAAAALCGPDVTAIATDASDSSLILLSANARLNGVAGSVRAVKLDWHSDRDVERVAAMGPFAAILGAALQPEAWTDRIWNVLGRLASTGRVPRATAGVSTLASTEGDPGLGLKGGDRGPASRGCAVTEAGQGTVTADQRTGMVTEARQGTVTEALLSPRGAVAQRIPRLRPASRQGSIPAGDVSPTAAAQTFPAKDCTGRAPRAEASTAATLIALAHSVGSLPHPPAGGIVTERERVSGLAYGMHTAWSDAETDFELVLMAGALGGSVEVEPHEA
eukprot:scaffold351_cov117-Isochrysis_galbana.AAC.4